MPKPKKPESFDVAGTAYRQNEDPRASLKQALSDYQTQVPTRNFTSRIQGNSVTIYCHCHERGLGDIGRRASQVDAMSKFTDSFVKGLKKHYKEITGATLSMTVAKGSIGYDLQKVSLNDRWEIVYRRGYTIDDLISLPEED